MFFFSHCFWICWVIAEPPEWQINPQQTDFFYLDHHLPPYVKLFCWPCLGNGIQVNTEAWDNWNAFFFPFPPPSLASANYLCASYTLYVLDVSPAVTAHARSLLPALFYFSPSALLPASSVPLNFPGTLSCPFQIGLGLHLPRFMSLCQRIPQLI